ncbi:DNA-directed RNA polymerase subunit beta', partial [Candidatus Dojkabacteria bacterium]|nr:DNA-directed RNA polymerase subunit beta' [Candidatus Dojkabacteria bacterium]
MKLKDFDALKITLASPEEILSWSHGEVKKAETINYRTQRAEVDGLMCERIFGPTKNYECYCGKYKKVRYKGIVCDKCGVEVIHKRVRRERLGHIKLAAPVTHVWFAYGLPNKLALILGVPQKKLESVIYFARYIVVNVDDELKKEAVDKVANVRESKLDVINKDLEAELKILDDKVKEDFDKLKEKYKNKKEAYALHEDQVNYKLRQQKAKVREQFARLEQEIVNEYKELSELVKRIEIKETLSEEDHSKILDNDLPQFYEIKMGAEAIQELLEKTDLNEVARELREDLTSKSKQKKAKAIQRLRIVEGMVRNNIKPEWTIITNLPVISPELRPIIQLAGGRFATSDLNDLYRRVINRNNRLKRLIDLGAPQIILRNEKRMMQEAVDALIDNSHRTGRAVMNSRRQPYKSLADMLRGKRGRFRQNLLGKRVDYSGRSVIVSGPDLKLNECGIPNMVALELFKPFVIREIILRDLAPNIKAAKNFFEKKDPEVWDILDEV